MNSESNDLDDDFDDDLDLGALELANFPRDNTTQKAIANFPPSHHYLDVSQIDTYIYPTNLPIRDYQYSIVNRAIFHNVLVALPTGLGKTFIASTVMLNFLRWFPNLKIIFMAPTKPLVAQQIKACCGITGIPSSKVAILLDRTRKNRSEIWDEKSVFFTTPQVVENDLTAGIVDPKLVVLLVVDEAHRSKGNYAYNNVVKFISRFSKFFRVLALTATPAADVEGVQEIVNNLHISYVEVRTEKSIDIFKYLKRKKIERITADLSDEVNWAIEQICRAAAPILKTANEKGIYDIQDPLKINAFTAMDAQQRLVRNQAIPEGLKWANYFILQLLIVIGQCLRRLNIYGVRAFYLYFLEKYTEFNVKYNSGKLKNHMAAKFYTNPGIAQLMSKCETLVKDPGFLGHRKLEIVIFELSSFFEKTWHEDSRVIIFTEFRQSALDIVRAIEHSSSVEGSSLKKALRPHIFIGQAKEKEKFDEAAFLSKGKKKKAPKATDAATKKSASGKKSASKDILTESATSSEQAQISGMNQKMQKELIKQFKKGDYNVLVATSIGEEGLDIGEVDLIICYDLTSSPIKNVQRMGRTGRNRDGKVILLFSSNEETKFDKAMSGYEYIQNHIMKGLVEMVEQNRIIPLKYTPKVEEKEIEIPKENIEIKQEDDEDEIIRIATKYMNQSQSSGSGGAKKKAGKAKSAQKGKIEKRFFMPDDVETGFRLAGLVLKGDPETAKRRRIEEHGSDILDSILDSDEEKGPAKVDTKSILEGLDEVEKLPPKSPSLIRAARTKFAPKTILAPEVATKLDKKVKKPTLGVKPLRQPEIFNWRSNSGLILTHGSNENKASKLSSEEKDNLTTDLDPEEKVETAKEVVPSNLALNSPDIKPSATENPPKSAENHSDKFDDEFSDDEDILALVKKTQLHWNNEASAPLQKSVSNSNLSMAKHASRGTESTPPQPIPSCPKEKIFKLQPQDGILDEAQKQELYLHYYAAPDHSHEPNFVVPLTVPQDGYEIGHSEKSQKLISFCLSSTSLTDLKAEYLLDLFDTVAALAAQTQNK